MRYVVREGKVRGEGGYLGELRTWWPEIDESVIKYHSRESADLAAKNNGGRVVRLLNHGESKAKYAAVAIRSLLDGVGQEGHIEDALDVITAAADTLWPASKKVVTDPRDLKGCEDLQEVGHIIVLDPTLGERINEMRSRGMRPATIALSLGISRSLTYFHSSKELHHQYWKAIAREEFVQHGEEPSDDWKRAWFKSYTDRWRG